MQGQALTHQRIVSPSNLIVLAAGGVYAALGLAVLVGWYTHNVTLMQVVPTFAPMQYNTALGFLLCGIGLLALVYGCSRVAIACGTIVAALGLVTLGEYLFDVNLGVDRLLIEPSITVKTSHPGRRPPNTALCLALAGIAFLIISGSERRAYTFPIAGPLGAIVLALGLAASIGYLTGLQTYGWGYLTHMAVHAAAGCVVLGGGIMVYTWQMSEAETAEASRKFPVLFGIGVLTVALGLWQALIAQERALIERTVGLAAASVQSEIMVQADFRALLHHQAAWDRYGLGAPFLQGGY